MPTRVNNIASEESRVRVREADVPHPVSSFQILFPPLTLNEFININRSHWSKGARLKKDYDSQIAWAIKLAGIKKLETPISIHMHFILPSKRADRDAHFINAKFLADALVDCQVIPDDRFDTIVGWSFSWEINPKNPSILVTISRC